MRGCEKIANAILSHAMAANKKQKSIHEYANCIVEYEKEFKPKINAITILLLIPDAEYENYYA